MLWVILFCWDAFPTSFQNSSPVGNGLDLGWVQLDFEDSRHAGLGAQGQSCLSHCFHTAALFLTASTEFPKRTASHRQQDIKFKWQISAVVTFFPKSTETRAAVRANVLRTGAPCSTSPVPRAGVPSVSSPGRRKEGQSKKPLWRFVWVTKRW